MTETTAGNTLHYTLHMKDLLIKLFQLVVPAIDVSFISISINRILPLGFGVIQFRQHATNFFDCSETFVITLNGRHNSQMMNLEC